MLFLNSGVRHRRRARADRSAERGTVSVTLELRGGYGPIPGLPRRREARTSRP
jgi:hypothetical protein